MTTVTTHSRRSAAARPSVPAAVRPSTRADIAIRRPEERARAIGGPRAWIRAARVRQWTKNLLVIATPAAVGVSATRLALTPVLVTFAVFCLLATGTYLANDVHDVDDDRRHPTKRQRPIASGALAPAHALVVAAISIVVGLGIAMTVNWSTFTAASVYVVLNAAYTLCLRNIAFVELIAISGAFVLRAAAGAAAADVPASMTFIAAVAFGALSIAAGKRYADLVDPSAKRSRAVLDRYSDTSLTLTIALAAAATLVTYGGWALADPAGGLTLGRELTVIPFAFAFLRYVLIASRGNGGAPEQVLFADRPLQLLGLIWLLLFAAGA